MTKALMAFILLTSINSYASFTEVLCINKTHNETFQKIQFNLIEDNLYSTTLYLLNSDYTMSSESLQNAQEFTIGKKDLVINSLDLVVTFKIPEKENPVRPARINLLKYKKKLRNWQCKVYYN